MNVTYHVYVEGPGGIACWETITTARGDEFAEREAIYQARSRLKPGQDPGDVKSLCCIEGDDHV